MHQYMDLVPCECLPSQSLLARRKEGRKMYCEKQELHVFVLYALLVQFQWEVVELPSLEELKNHGDVALKDMGMG